MVNVNKCLPQQKIITYENLNILKIISVNV